jgi:hypothetical protein
VTGVHQDGARLPISNDEGIDRCIKQDPLISTALSADPVTRNCPGGSQDARLRLIGPNDIVPASRHSFSAGYIGIGPRAVR